MSTWTFPVDENGKLDMTAASLEDLEAAFRIRRRAEGELTRLEDPEGDIEQIETDIGLNEREWANIKSYYETRIKQMNDKMQNPRCNSNKSVLAIVHHIEVLNANLEAHEKEYREKQEALQKELNKLQDTKKACKAVLPFDLAQIRVYAANKYHCDVSKGYPHPGAFADPLCHDHVNRYVSDCAKLQWHEGWENGTSVYPENPPDGRIV